jgi:hypothetical protein
MGKKTFEFIKNQSKSLNFKSLLSDENISENENLKDIRLKSAKKVGELAGDGVSLLIKKTLRDAEKNRAN